MFVASFPGMFEFFYNKILQTLDNAFFNMILLEVYSLKSGLPISVR